ncbi:hypothetical protein D9611_008594 [Ephemerocybe angulata]|uniref:RING-type domain-containing protein n=1 Tax=Ephemerocybe angulata TaxID=980116 RepID=A0A8H5AYN4_9AGAR|nr:hypothetical protein D9611_008594 [Tulosesus angulatus]
MEPEDRNPPNRPPLIASHQSDEVDSAVVRAILQKITDVLPNVDIKSDYLLALVVHCLPFGLDDAAQLVLQHLLDAETSSAEPASTHEDASSASPDYTDVSRTFDRRPSYTRLALYHLQNAFPLISARHICTVFSAKNQLYVPTYLSLLEDHVGHHATNIASPPGYEKGKEPAWKDEEFEKEKRWLEGHFAANAITATPDSPSTIVRGGSGDRQDLLSDAASTLPDTTGRGHGTDIECQCCFSSHPPSSISRCPKSHAFCHACVEGYAATRLGEQQYDIPCMYSGQDKCPTSFSPSTLEMILSRPLLILYARLRQQKELKEACIDGLEECPFCDYACVMEVTLQEAPTFVCQNVEQCGQVSCRICRAKDHSGVLCADLDGDRDVGGRLAIEEAMTRALMRACPNCDCQFIKEDGCNKMTCPQCGAFSCYVCRKAVAGYDHFDGRCPLYYDDSVEERHAQEVEAAYRNALALHAQVARQTKDHPNVPPPGNGAILGAAEAAGDYDLGVPMDVVYEDEASRILDEMDVGPNDEAAQRFSKDEKELEPRGEASTSSGSAIEATVNTSVAAPDALLDRDVHLLQYAVDLAKNDAKNAKRRLKYAENKLKNVELDLYKAGLISEVSRERGSSTDALVNGRYPKTHLELSVERAMRMERVERAQAECARYNQAVLVALKARFSI